MTEMDWSDSEDSKMIPKQMAINEIQFNFMLGHKLQMPFLS